MARKKQEYGRCRTSRDGLLFTGGGCFKGRLAVRKPTGRFQTRRQIACDAGERYTLGLVLGGSSWLGRDRRRGLQRHLYNEPPGLLAALDFHDPADPRRGQE